MEEGSSDKLLQNHDLYQRTDHFTPKYNTLGSIHHKFYRQMIQ